MFFSKAKKQAASSSPKSHSTPADPPSPSSPGNAIDTGSPRTTKRASAFFDLNSAPESSQFTNILANPPPPPPPAPAAAYRPYGDQRPIARSRVSSSSSFQTSSMSDSNPVSRRVSQNGQPALLFKPPLLAAHRRDPSIDQAAAFDGFDGSYDSLANSPSPAKLGSSSFNFDDSLNLQPEVDPTLAHTENIGKDSRPGKQSIFTNDYDASAAMSEVVPEPSRSFAATMRAEHVTGSPEPSYPARATIKTVQSVTDDDEEEQDAVPFSLQEPEHESETSQHKTLRPKDSVTTLPIHTAYAALDPVRSPVGSPSAAAAAIASASLKSQLKIGEVRTVASQRTPLQVIENNYYVGEEGFSGIETSAENTAFNSDEDEDHDLHNQTYTANPPRAIAPVSPSPKPRPASESDSSYVNVGSNADLESTSSGVVVPRAIGTPTEVHNPYTSHILEPQYNETSTAPEHVEYQEGDHARYHSVISQYSASTYLSDMDEPDDFKLYHPQPHRPNMNSDMAKDGDNKVRASMVSVASSDILNSSGGIPVDNFSTSDQADLDAAGREQALRETEGQLVRGGSNLARQSMPLMQRRTSQGRTLSSLMGPGPSGLRNSHMPQMTDANGTYYPAPIPVELKLPPLLSKKNQSKAQKGRPMSRRRSSFMRPDSAIQIPAPPVWHVETGVSASDRRSMMSRRVSMASTLNGVRQSGEFDRETVLEQERGDEQAIETESLQESHVDGEPKEHDDAETRSFVSDVSSAVDIKGKGVSAPLRDHEAELEDGAGQRGSTMSMGRIGQLKDESWGTRNSMEPRTYSQFINSEYYTDFAENEDSDDGIDSDAATIQSDDEYQEDVLVDEEETAKLAAEAQANEGMGLIDGAKLDDFAFTSFNPNSAITDRGLLANSINYSSTILPAVGVQPPSLIEELERRKATRKARLQKTYYDTNTGNAIATETLGRLPPSADQLLREPHSGHPLDARHSKSLLELQYIADKDYEVQKHYQAGIHAAVESDRMSRLGLSTPNLMAGAASPLMAPGLAEEEGESLGARRARLKKKRQEEKAARLEEQYQNETLAQRRARLKREKQTAAAAAAGLAVETESVASPAQGQEDMESFVSQQPSVIAT